MASKHRNMFHKNKTQETTENAEINYSYSVMAMRRTPVQTMTLSSGQVFNYVNATHEYHQEDIDSWFRLRSDSYDGTSYHWEILGWNNTSRDYPSHLKLSYLPVTDLGHPALHKIIAGAYLGYVKFPPTRGGQQHLRHPEKENITSSEPSVALQAAPTLRIRT
ncbi:hypothetical protein AAG570_013179 [Ranatra chinensis]|uniref:Uncharacterized protein n=1 Tax=Ranatra chinensis TaxID=642074 RepID=A0ABD0YG05_9HEMI